MVATQQTENDGPLHQLSRNAWQSLLLLGVVTLALGAIVLAWPGQTLLVAGVLFGIYLVVSGVAQLFAAFGTHFSTGLRVLAFISGTLSIILGIFCFRDQLESIMLLALWIGIGWLFRGIGQLVAAASDKNMPARGWQGISGVIIAIGGGVLMIYPFSSIAILTLMTGIWLIVIGVLEVINAFQVRRRLKALA